MSFTKGDYTTCEPVQVGMQFRPCPIEPTCWVILTPGIVVTLLSPEKFIASHQHGHALAHHQGGQKIPDLPKPQGLDRRVCGRPFHATIPGMVGIVSVSILLTVGFVVFLVVADEVCERKTIVTRDKVE